MTGLYDFYINNKQTFWGIQLIISAAFKYNSGETAKLFWILTVVKDTDLIQWTKKQAEQLEQNMLDTTQNRDLCTNQK